MTWTTWSTRLFLAGLVAAAVLSLLVPAAPDYDAWAYLTWGRELAHLELSTTDGPAFKPLPVLLCALLTPLGDAAPDAWLAVVRAGALAAVALAAVLAFDVARERNSGHASVPAGWVAGGHAAVPTGWVAGGHASVPAGWVAGAGAAAAVLFTGGLIRHAAGGDAEPLLVAFAFGGWQRHRAGRRGQALSLATLAALCRVEAWPFVFAYALWTIGWRRAAALAAGILAAWFLPELAGSGELFRSSERASVPNPGAPATADVPFLASLGDAAALLPLPLAAFALLTLWRRRSVAALPLIAGAAWCLIVAVMAEVGFSGEARYAMPGVAATGIAAGAGLAVAVARIGAAWQSRAGDGRSGGGWMAGARSGGGWMARARSSGGWMARARSGGAWMPGIALAFGIAVVAATVLIGIRELDGLRGQLEYRNNLAGDLRRAIARAGGRDVLLACGRPAVGRYRGTMTAYALDVPKQRVRADGRSDAVTLRSRLGPRDPVEPPPHGKLIATAGEWRIEADCPRSGGR